MGNALDFFKGMEDAAVTTRGKWFEEGEYELEVISLKMNTSRKGDTAFIADFKVLKSSNAAVEVGAQRNWYVDLKQDSALGNILGFGVALLGVNPKCDKDEKAKVKAIIAKAADENGGKLVGKKVGLSAVVVKTKADKPFTRHDFSSVAS